MSFAIAESRLMKKCPPVLKAAYMIAKVLQSYTTKSMYSSYVLKTASLMTYAECIIGNGHFNSEQSEFSDEELTLCVRRVLQKLAVFVQQDAVPLFFLPTFMLKLWKFEEYLKFSHQRLQRLGLNYEQIFNVVVSTGSRDPWTEKIERGFALSHLLFWSVLEEGNDIRIDFPQISASI